MPANWRAGEISRRHAKTYSTASVPAASIAALLFLYLIGLFLT